MSFCNGYRYKKNLTNINKGLGTYQSLNFNMSFISSSLKVTGLAL